MQDFCFRSTDQATLLEALDPLGLMVDGQVVGDWLWVGRVVKTPGIGFVVENALDQALVEQRAQYFWINARDFAVDGLVVD